MERKGGGRACQVKAASQIHTFRKCFDSFLSTLVMCITALSDESTGPIH